MIRMGRSSKNDDTSKDTTALNDNTTAFPHNEGLRPAEPAAVSESDAMARDIKEGRLSGFVGAGTVLTGETNFQSMLRVDGHLTGKVMSDEGTLIVGSTGQVDANIVVAQAIVNGVVNGDIDATEKLELGRTARVVGNIRAPRLVMSDGAILEGSCNMIQSKEELDTKIQEEKAHYATADLEPVSTMETEEEDTVETLSAETDESAELFVTEDDESSENETAEAATN
ncbi:MAG: polymer-forming cytoskeletal protein [Pyrinomonadaceae bacterium]|nr:polymer-forming cytoskeletal protein [Pyrinomonadaceae bacterium]